MSSSRLSLESQYLRECNRILDTDRNTKKRGLQKILESLPWETKKVSEKAELITFMHTHVVKNVLVSMSDSVEKCRELSLKILQKFAEIWGKTDVVTHEDVVLLAQRLCERVNDVPFPETAEELRLLTLEVLVEVVKKEVKIYKKLTSGNSEDVATEAGEGDAANSQNTSEGTEANNQVGGLTVSTGLESIRNHFVQRILLTLSKTLSDSFPQVKRISAELVSLLCKNYPHIMKFEVKLVSKGLVTNAGHQHSKTRQLSISALGKCLTVVPTSTYRTLLQPIVSTSGATSVAAAMQSDTSSHSSISLLTLFQRILSDRTPLVKIELAKVLGQVIEYRIQLSIKQHMPLIDMDFELISLLVLLSSEDVEDVAKAGYQQLVKALSSWKRELVPLLSEMKVMPEDEIHVDNAEIEMRNAEEAAITNVEMGPQEMEVEPIEIIPIDEIQLLHNFFNTYLQDIFNIIFDGIDNWTIDSKIRYLRAMQCFVRYVAIPSPSTMNPSHIGPIEGCNLEGISLVLLLGLATQIREDDHNVRIAVENTVSTIGEVVSINHLLEVILPRVLGEISGSDTAQQRTSMIRVLTHIWKGSKTVLENALNKKDSLAEDTSRNALLLLSTYQSAIELTSQATIHPGLLAYRDTIMREALVLLCRALVNTCPYFLTRSPLLQQNLCLMYLHLLGRVTTDSGNDNIPDIARKDFEKLAEKCALIKTNNTSTITTTSTSKEQVIALLTPYFIPLLAQLLFSSSNISASITANGNYHIYDDTRLLYRLKDGYLPPWDTKTAAATAIATNSSSSIEPQTANRIAFEVLLRECPYSAWKYWSIVLPILQAFCKPRPPPSEGTAEYNMKQYAAVRGEEEVTAIYEQSDIDIRLSFLALLEGIIRDASNNWEISCNLSESSEYIIKEILLPNLIWRVGRVEATIRKVALACTYAILKAGAVKTESLFKIATDIVPVLVSHLDDMESTPRLMACLGLAVIFERLRTFFSDQSIREMYPKIIARLDDSNDDVRIAVCTTLQKFFVCGTSKHCYTGTLIDYMLDQLFIHLDDPNPTIQDAVFAAICVAANEIDRPLVLKKAENNRLSHRSPVLCDKLIVEVQGFEILEN